MWAIVEGDQVVRLLTSNLNVQVPGREEPIGNIALLTPKERREHGVYEVKEAEKVDARYYAATYTRYVIDHKRGRVTQINEIQPQPLERIQKYRIQELNELRDSLLKGTINFEYQRLGDKYKTLSVKITDELIKRLVLAECFLSSSTYGQKAYIEDIDGKVHMLASLERSRLGSFVTGYMERCHTLHGWAVERVTEWDEDADALMEWDFEEKILEDLEKFQS